ncbi:hypothetical protein Dsin_026598 [Dipteronia sinensis]|uniref:cellulase n=1 Tax=Dipteronia sinensis TaxID=43782 RepID=A0AAE0DY67_9ROSI|nr:hypothetical protein Dsin_026598 [Dipteronia sinensis]
MLSWSTIEFRFQLETKKELSNALDAIKWGTDYFIKAHPQPDVLYGEVGDGDSNHACWKRPEDPSNDQNSSSDLAAETAAALTAASVAVRPSEAKYADELVVDAKQLFDFARKFVITMVFTRTAFLLLENSTPAVDMRTSGCGQLHGLNVLRMIKRNNNFKKTAGGLLWFLPWNNLQYSATASLVSAVYSKYLTDAKASLQCPGGAVQPSYLISLAPTQADYLLGQNPKGMSYMVGFGSNYPTQAHHSVNKGPKCGDVSRWDGDVVQEGCSGPECVGWGNSWWAG